ncbi:phosphoribosylamine--glycine ligase, partial [Alphaproteobacteria bacterium]|nr:phosphoribosylamine--glycine ligase [Alphaproteobacteria bacterium]
MKILIIGGGGREHAMARAISASKKCTHLFAAPGNPGIAEFATCLNLPIDDHLSIISECQKLAIELVVIGPEVPLVAGLADRLRAHEILVFGPSAAAARLEGSKYFARDFCQRYNIPQPAYARFT